MQLKAGFYIEGINRLFSDRQAREELKPLTEHNTKFSALTDYPPVPKTVSPLLAVLHNLILRDFPSPATALIHKRIEKALALTNKQVNSKGDIRYSVSDESLKDDIFRALHSPAYDLKTVLENAGSDFNRKAIQDGFLPRIGEHFVRQLQTDRTYSSFSHFAGGDEPDFQDSVIDFVIEMPYPIRDKQGLWIQTDLSDNETGTDFLRIAEIEKYADKAGFEFVVLKKRDFENGLKKIRAFTYNSYFDILKKNTESPLQKRTRAKKALQLALSPFLVGAFQVLLLKYIFAGRLNTEKKQWRIAVKEQDVPAAALALEDFKLTYENLCCLYACENHLPEIELSVFSSEDFLHSPLHGDHKAKSFTEFKPEEKYDLFVDISAMKAENKPNLPQSKALNNAVLRPTPAKVSEPKLLHTDLPVLKNMPEKFSDAASRAARYFSQSIIRKERLTKDEEAVLHYIVSRKNSLGLMFEQSSKLDSALLAAYLSPASYLYIAANDSDLYQTFENIRAKGFGNTYYLNDSKLKVKKRREVVNKFVNRGCNLCLMSAEIANDSSTLELFSRLKKNKGAISGIMHRASEQICESLPDFTPADFGIKQTYEFLKNEFGNQLTFTGFAAYSDYTGDEDIETGFPSKDFKIFKRQMPEQAVVEIITTGSEAEQGENISEERMKQHFEDKAKRLSELVQSEKRINKAVIISPENKISYYADFLKKECPNKQIIVNSTLSRRETSSGSPDLPEDLLNNYKLFKEKDKMLWLCPELFTADLDLLEADTVILSNIPKTPEKIWEYRNLFATNSRNKKLIILFDDKEVSTYEMSDTTLEDGSVESMEEIHRISPDAHFNQLAFRKTHPGREKELQIIEELLSDIRQPADIPAHTISERINSEFGINAELLAQPPDKPTKLYLNSGRKTYGFVDFRSYDINYEYSSFPDDISKSVLNFLKFEIIKRYGKNTSFFNLLYQVNKRKNISGIESFASKLSYGETGTIDFSSENNCVEELYSKLDKYFPAVFTRRTVRNALNLPTGKEAYDFLNQFEDIKIVNTEIDMPETVIKMYRLYRNKKHTIRALNRLLAIGIIKSWQRNSVTGNIIVELKKIRNTEYEINLKKILKRYVSLASTKKIIERLNRYPGKTILHKAARLYINFVYDYILPAKYEAVKSSENLCKSIVSGKTKQNINELIELENRYKYLSKMQEAGTADVFDTVFNLLRAAANRRADLKHIYFSAERLLSKEPDNFLYKICKAYSGAVISSSMEEARQHSEVLVEVFTDDEFNRQNIGKEATDKKIRFFNMFFTELPSLRSETEPMIFIKTHADWLANFNKHFLKDMFVT